MARGQKRTAAAHAEEPGAKRVAEFLKQQGVTKSEYAPALEIVKHPLAGLTDEVCKMILAAMPWSLSVPADTRTPPQETVVGMITEVADTVHAALQQAAAIEVGKVDELTVGKAGVEGQIQEKEAAIAAAQTYAEDCNKQLEEAKSEAVNCTQALQSAEAEVVSVGTQLETAVASKAYLEKVLAESFQGLKDGTFEEGAVEAAVQIVMAAVEKSGLEGSLIATLPAVLARRERGAFDLVVIQGAEQGMSDKITALGAEAESLTASRSEKATAVEAAKASLEEAASRESEAAGKLQAASAASAEAVAAIEDTRAELTKLEAGVAEAEAVRDAKQQELESYCSYNLSIFQMLRDRTAAKEVEVEPQEKMEEEAKEKMDLEEAKEEIMQEPSEEPKESIAEDVIHEVAEKVADKVETVLTEDQQATLVAVAGA